ncbi:hypothetical protein [Streptomyces bobili]|uniref:hypothetical protein n=1 Tax=Streptomyces bobili TaxID=67280 RepID=UPI00371323F7
MKKFRPQPGFVAQAFRFVLDPNAVQERALRSHCGADPDRWTGIGRVQRDNASAADRRVAWPVVRCARRVFGLQCSRPVGIGMPRAGPVARRARGGGAAWPVIADTGPPELGGHRYPDVMQVT